MVNIDLPDWLTSESATVLSGGAAESKLSDALTVAGFKTKQLQESLETEIEDHIPMKAMALLGNAALQRTMIKASNVFMGWEAYPTYYGATRLYDPEANAIVRLPAYEKNGSFDTLRDFARSLSSFSQKHPNIGICVIVADQSDYSSVNPAICLMRDTITSSEVAAELSGALGGGSVDVVLSAYENRDDYFHDFYTTDHHWNGYGALRAYNMIPDRYGLQRFHDIGPLDGLEGFKLNGSNARQALDLLNESASEPRFDTEGLSVVPDSHSLILEPAGVDILWSEVPKSEYNFYESWYGTWNDAIVENAQSTSNENALMICDSFGTGLRYLIARNYNDTYVRYDMHDLKEDMNSTLEDRVEESGCDAIFFVARPQAYLDFLRDYPFYFD